MAIYTVHLTFRAPGLHGRFEWRRPMLGRQSIHLNGAHGALVATVVVNSADGPGFAGLRATELVLREWRDHGAGGPLERLSWRAERQRAIAGLLGRRRRGGGGWGAGAWGGPDSGPPEGPDDGGLAGVREPRRPRPAPPSLSMSLPEPGARPS